MLDLGLGALIVRNFAELIQHPLIRWGPLTVRSCAAKMNNVENKPIEKQTLITCFQKHGRQDANSLGS